MSTKTTYFYRSLLFCILACSHGARANENVELAKLEKPFKVAVVKNAPGSDAIMSGELVEGASELASATMDAATQYEKAMGLCALNIKTKDYAAADSACSDAIQALAGIEKDSETLRYLSAMAYSNRAIVRYFMSDTLGAYSDLNRALEFSQDEIVMGNLTRLNVAYLKSQVSP
ncbi:hypothetical protein [Thalassotalea mangrovi]|uniref:Tetratricopeptide repeat protein n=1 Tax=Thalassotalea mangrovi TaxID=2572245 RepID=A0A4V5NUM3_9GAMM|nr:hypothetical protein [Thalassotalea mangrovi]TKB47061.1 hypothetical protein E8M12_02035 [Thalassotalea mangrovi]